MNQENKNAGYEIIERFPVGEQGFVLGYNENAPMPYVTWQFRTAEPNHYFWGHYTSTKEAAYTDYHGRIKQEIKYDLERKRVQPLVTNGATKQHREWDVFER